MATRYTKSHEYVREDNGTFYLGISDRSFRQVVLGLLVLSGVAMLVSSLPGVIANLY